MLAPRRIRLTAPAMFWIFADRRNGRPRLWDGVRRCKERFRGAGDSCVTFRFTLPAEWRLEVESLAVQLGFPKTTANEIEEQFLAVLQKLVKTEHRLERVPL
jgi:hypothetical protein